MPISFNRGFLLAYVLLYKTVLRETKEDTIMNLLGWDELLEKTHGEVVKLHIHWLHLKRLKIIKAEQPAKAKSVRSVSL